MEQSGILGERHPLLSIRGFNAFENAQRRHQAFQQIQIYKMTGQLNLNRLKHKNFLSSKQNYPLTSGIQTNLYKCFISSFLAFNSRGVAGLIHPEGPYDTPKGGEFRENIYYLPKTFSVC